MLERLTDLPSEIDGIKAIGKVSKEDYETTLEPLLDAARRDGRRIKLVYQLGPEFEGFTPSGAWEDAKLGFQNSRLFAGCALVSDRTWIRQAVQLAGVLMPCPVRAFPNGGLGKALEWLASLSEQFGFSHRLLPEFGVVVLEVRHALRAHDFEALARTADAWIDGHGQLQGIVIHARTFPGWENLGSLWKHLQFIRDHHRKVRRIALAADGKLGSIAPRIAELFAKPEVKRFTYDTLDDAIAWAGRASAQKIVSAESGAHSAHPSA